MPLPDTSPHMLTLLRWTAEQVAASPAGSEIASPCISVCRMDPASGVCNGCLRTMDEITQWGRATDDAKRVLWQQLAERASIMAATGS